MRSAAGTRPDPERPATARGVDRSALGMAPANSLTSCSSTVLRSRGRGGLRGDAHRQRVELELARSTPRTHGPLQPTRAGPLESEASVA